MKKMKHHFSTVRSASRIILGACLIALGLLAGGTPLPAGGPEDDAAKEKKVYHATRILISGMIDEVLVTTVQRRSNDAIQSGANLIIFEIDSDGGLVTSAMALSRAIDGLSDSGVHTVAYIPRRAYSAAAMAAISCKDIYMKVGSSLGDAAPISMLGKLEGVEREKLESALRSRFEDLARRNSYPVGLAKSMVTITVTVAEAKNSKTGQVRYIEEDELFGLGPDWKKGKMIVGPTELLTMDADKAAKYGFARGLVEGIEELRKLFDIEGEITVYSLTASEEVVGLLNNMYLKALLVLVGLIGIYVEMSTPGFGIPGTAALVAFGILFGVSFLAGEPDYLAPILCLLGLILLSMEVFVTPGFGVMGVSGVILLLGSFVLALSNLKGVPSTDVEWGQLFRSLAAMAVILVAFFTSAWLLGRLLPSVPVLGRLIIAPSEGSDGSSRGAAETIAGFVEVGEEGTASSTLRPAGKAKFGERLIDVVTEGDFIDAGARVRIIEVHGNRIIVKPVDNSGATA